MYSKNRKKLFNKTALKLMDIDLKTHSKTTVSSDQVVLIHVGHNIHTSSLQEVLGIVGSSVGLLLNNVPGDSNQEKIVNVLAVT